MDWTTSFQQLIAAIFGWLPTPLLDLITQVTQFFAGLLQGIGL